MKKRALMWIMAGALAAVPLTGCTTFEGSDVVVKMGEEEITADLANFYARYTQAQYETYYGAYFGDNMWSSEAAEGESYEESVKNTLLEDLETMLLLEKHMGDYGIELTDGEKAAIKKAAKEFDEDNSLENKEKISGDKKTVERMLTLLAIQGKMRTAIEAGVDTEVTDEEAAQKSMQYLLFSYKTTDEDGKSKELTVDEKAAVKEKAEALAQDLKDGGDLATLAAAEALEVQTATFDKESTVPDAALVKAADQLQLNESTDVVETDAGCYVGKVISLLDPQATENKKQVIINDRKTKLFTDTCDQWKEGMDIKVHENVWKKIDFNDLSVTMKQKIEQPYTDELKTDDQEDAGNSVEE